MGNIFLFSLIVGLALAILLIPLKINKNAGKAKQGFSIFTAILLIIAVFSFYYTSNLDRNLTSLWPALIIITALGAAASTGIERKIKALLFVGSLLMG
ncbi:MAG: hypothetical protein K0S25_1151, partial [Bacillus sp. (in: firmicutes)]|nr:hypothetical protein [Bacillus sp. (in: firmicutes)]